MFMFLLLLFMMLLGSLIREGLFSTENKGYAKKPHSFFYDFEEKNFFSSLTVNRTKKGSIFNCSSEENTLAMHSASHQPTCYDKL